MKHLTFILLLAFVGCFTMQSIEVSKRTRIYQADYKTVFQAVVGYCQETSLPILTVDKDLGIVNTDWKENGGILLNSRLEINFTKEGQGDTTKVILTVTGQQQSVSGSGNYGAATMTDGHATDVYSAVFDGIKRHIGSN